MRHYLSDDDVRYQRKINRAVVETIHPAPVINRRRTPPEAPSDPWHCDISEAEDGTVTVKVIVRSAEDDNLTVRFRGESYGVDSETFTLSAADLNTSVKIYLVKVLYGGQLAFRLATSHHSGNGPSSGCVRISTVFRRNDQINVTMEYDRMFDWPDRFHGDGRFTADLVFSGIIHNDDEPQPIPFYEFTETAEQYLLIWNNYAMLVNGVYVIGTSVVNADGSASGYTLISLRPSGLETAALRIFWAAVISDNGSASVPGSIHYEITGASGYPYAVSPGRIRIPVIALSGKDNYNPVRYILPDVGIPNIPELSINPFGQDLQARRCAWVYVDHNTEKVKLTILADADGLSLSVPTFELPFSTFSDAGGGRSLYLCARYSTSSHQWTSLWYELDGTPITAWTAPGSADRDHAVMIAVIAWDSAGGWPYVVGQNYQRTVVFDSGYYRYADIADQIYQLDQRVTALEQRN